MTAATPCYEVDEITGAVCSLPCTHSTGKIGGEGQHRDKWDEGLVIVWPVRNVS